MRRNARVDSNQPQIIKTFRAYGATVQLLHMVGKGCPDAIVGYAGVNLLVDSKDGSKSPSKRKLTEDEQLWHEQWKGQVCIVESEQDAIELMRKIEARNAA